MNIAELTLEKMRHWDWDQSLEAEHYLRRELALKRVSKVTSTSPIKSSELRLLKRSLARVLTLRRLHLSAQKAGKKGAASQSANPNHKKKHQQKNRHDKQTTKT